MIIHPKISHFIAILNKGNSNSIDENDIKKLWESGATATEAAIVLHLGFNFQLANAETYIYAFQLWQPENIQDIAYQTFLYMNYNPEDPNFLNDEDKVKFSILPSSKKSTDME